MGSALIIFHAERDDVCEWGEIELDGQKRGAGAHFRCRERGVRCIGFFIKVYKQMSGIATAYLFSTSVVAYDTSPRPPPLHEQCEGRYTAFCSDVSAVEVNGMLARFCIEILVG